MSDDPATNAAPQPPPNDEPKVESPADAPKTESEPAPTPEPAATAEIKPVLPVDQTPGVAAAFESKPTPEEVAPTEPTESVPAADETLTEAASQEPQPKPAVPASDPFAEAIPPISEVSPEPPTPAPDAFAEATPPVSEPVAELPTPETTPSASLPEAQAEPESLDAKPEETPVEPAPEVPAAEPSEPAPKPAKRTRKKVAPAPSAATPAPAAAATTAAEQPAEESNKKWYAIKVQSGREDSIKAAILRKVAIEGLEEFVGRIEIPVEEVVEKKQVRVKDKKTGEYGYQEKKVTKKKKKFHGYIFAELEFNDRILYLIRETSGVGDFLNMRGKPPVPEPMPEHEVQAMLTGVSAKPVGPGGKPVKVKLSFEKGDRVRIREGPFANSEGEVKSITEPKDPTDTPKVTVVVTLWGRPVDVELDYWQVDKV